MHASEGTFTKTPHVAHAPGRVECPHPASPAAAPAPKMEQPVGISPRPVTRRFTPPADYAGTFIASLILAEALLLASSSEPLVKCA